MKNIILAISALSLTISGCASNSSGIVENYTSPMLYQSYSCQQLAMENQSLATRVSHLRGQVDHDATNDKIMTGVGVVLFWPALFFIKGDGEAASQYAELKGQHDAVQQTFIAKNCGNVLAAQAAAPPVAGGWYTPPSGIQYVH